MVASRFIRHVTLTTGHVRDSYREEISAEALAVCRRLLDQLGADPTQTVPIPGVAGYSLGGRINSRCAALTVWADGPPSVCICTIGIAAHSRCGVPLWRALHQWGTTPTATDPDRVPPEPWVAAALESSITDHMDAAIWLGDLERCLAWAFTIRQSDWRSAA